MWDQYVTRHMVSSCNHIKESKVTVGKFNHLGLEKVDKENDGVSMRLLYLWWIKYMSINLVSHLHFGRQFEHGSVCFEWLLFVDVHVNKSEAACVGMCK